MNTKIGILSDTHGFIHLGIIKLMNQCDIIIHAGDIIDTQTLQALKPKQKLVAIQGNNDVHITHLNLVEKLNLPNGEIVIEHGHEHDVHQPSHDSLRAAYPNAKIIIYGHTHKQIIDQEKTPWVINPGAAGQVRNHGAAKCFVLEVNHPQEWKIIPYTFA